MNIYDIIILTVIALTMIVIVFRIFRKKPDGCSSYCAGCSGCPGAKRGSITSNDRTK